MLLRRQVRTRSQRNKGRRNNVFRAVTSSLSVANKANRITSITLSRSLARSRLREMREAVPGMRRYQRPTIPLHGTMRRHRGNRRYAKRQGGGTRRNHSVITTIRNYNLSRLVQSNIFGRNTRSSRIVNASNKERRRHPSLVRRARLLGSRVDKSRTTIRGRNGSRGTSGSVTPRRVLTKRKMNNTNNGNRTSRNTRRNVRSHIRVAHPSTNVLRGLLVRKNHGTFKPRKGVTYRRLRKVARQTTSSIRGQRGSNYTSRSRRRVRGGNVSPFPSTFLRFHKIVRHVGVLFRRRELASLVFLLGLLGDAVVMGLVARLGEPATTRGLWSPLSGTQQWAWIRVASTIS